MVSRSPCLTYSIPFRNKWLVLSAHALPAGTSLTSSGEGSRPEHDQNFMAEWLNINYLNAHFWPESDVTLVRCLDGVETSIVTFVFQTCSRIDPPFLPSSRSLHATLPHHNVFIVSPVPKPCFCVCVAGFLMGLDSGPATQGRHLILTVNLRSLISG